MRLSRLAQKVTTERKAGRVLFVSLALAAGIFFAWLAEEVLEGDTQQFDEQIRAFVHHQARPWLTDVMRLVTYFGSTIIISSLSVCAVIALYLMKWRRGVFLLLITMVGALVLNEALKLSFHRARPVPYFDIVAPSSYSFPSGHALFSFCLFGTLAAVVSNRAKGVGLKIGAWVAAAIIVMLVGFSRIYLGVHYPSDVLAGFAGAFVWIMSVTFVDRYLDGRESIEMK